MSKNVGKLLIKSSPTRGQPCSAANFPAFTGWLVLVVLALCSSTPAICQDTRSYDQVWVTGDGPDDVTRYRGSIADFNATRLEILTGESKRKRTFPTEKIAKVEAIYLPSHNSALAAIEAGDFKSAFESLDLALKKEQRQWVQREILALQIQILGRTDQLAARAQLFTKILSSEQATRFYHRIPLLWQGRVLGTADLSLAQQYLDSEKETLELIGASWMLAGAGRKTATEKLVDLANTIDSRIASLASAQLWRAKLLTAKQADVERWQAQVDSMPPNLRFGPLLIVGSTMARLKPADGNATEWVDRTVTNLMRIPILYPKHYHESAEALYVSARLLEEHRRESEAVLIYTELLRDFAQTTSATKAAQSRLIHKRSSR